MQKKDNDGAGEDFLLEIYTTWVLRMKTSGVPDYMATPDAFGETVARLLWQKIGKGEKHDGA